MSSIGRTALAALMALASPALAGRKAPPVTEASVGGHVVSVEFDSSRPEVGDWLNLTVRVQTEQGEPGPTALRVRLGMPDMGHWISEEERQELSAEGNSFRVPLPMGGLYRFRIWLEGTGETELKTAVDFDLDGKRLKPVVAP